MPHVLMATRLFLFYKERQGGRADSQNCPHWALDFRSYIYIVVESNKNFLFLHYSGNTT
jgi:hypothetical protein